MVNKEILPNSVESELLIRATLYTPFTIYMFLHKTRVTKDKTWLDWNSASTVINIFGCKCGLAVDDDMGFVPCGWVECEI